MSDGLKSFALLASLAEAEREAIAELTEARELAAKETLFREGSESEGLVLVESGTLRIASERAGREGLLRAGESLGALSLIAVGTREVTATAVEPARVRLLHRSAFHRLVDEAPRAAARLLEAVLAETAGLLRRDLDRWVSPDASR